MKELVMQTHAMTKNVSSVTQLAYWTTIGRAHASRTISPINQVRAKKHSVLRLCL